MPNLYRRDRFAHKVEKLISKERVINDQLMTISFNHRELGMEERLRDKSVMKNRTKQLSHINKLFVPLQNNINESKVDFFLL